ncbi:histidine phosphatase family protein [Deinococcus sp. KSM4-11]|uniref:histidine phosphatase family protein n=1 Tax=Deinococcus sp. KSM4-11 TaxID=2568654 RepID=UPI0010A50FF6|nr:histidine phosphatase family protein [Deinococcus sp. KSM4-11]THF87289.1 histidine phosphatase family protein [Deinococcus sp. KSM4-11]
MSELILVRHGQATPFDTDTDRLSPLGEAQARAVGEALLTQGVTPSAVIHGTLVRQRRTAELAACPDWPEATSDPRLAEYDGDGLVRLLAPQLESRETALASLRQTFRDPATGVERNRAIQTYLEAVAKGWQAGSLTHPDVEPWTAFQARVQAALDDLMCLPSGSTALVFTSGGVIGTVVALVLGAPDTAALALNWRVKNGSMTRLTFGGGRISLDSFNEIHHLPLALRSWR